VIKKIIFLLLLFSVVACAPYCDYSRIKVVEVIDGDTIRLADGKLLRYIGLDTPEIRLKKGEQFVYSPQPFSIEAKEFNAKLVENRFIRVEFDLERVDQYGRLLGYCFIDGVFVNAKLVEEGFAVTYTQPPNIKYADLFIKLQREARKQRRGLWGAYEVVDHTMAHRYINQIRTVKGKVLKTYRSKRCIFLNFGSNYKNDFTIVIFNSSLKNFYSQGIDPLVFYNGKTIEASGRIKEYNGPEIIVNAPTEIEVSSDN
jgi:micrococcal nuclease